ncbi:MAG: FHA domain-containing protein [Planctomycetes bacterium]|nr:FHA domain-containing protein [Planctomycetota bacterium]
MQLRLKVVKGKPQGHCLLFPNGEFMFGRGPECDVRPNSDLVSRQHCLLQVTDAGAVIRDLGSRNGTLINGQLVLGEHRLAHGDTLQLGPLVLEVRLDVEAASPGVSILDTAIINQYDTVHQERGAETCEQPLPAIAAKSS